MNRTKVNTLFLNIWYVHYGHNFYYKFRFEKTSLVIKLVFGKDALHWFDGVREVCLLRLKAIVSVISFTKHYIFIKITGKLKINVLQLLSQENHNISRGRNFVQWLSINRAQAVGKKGLLDATRVQSQLPMYQFIRVTPSISNI